MYVCARRAMYPRLSLAAAAPIIPVSRPSFSLFRVPPGMRSIHPSTSGSENSAVSGTRALEHGADLCSSETARIVAVLLVSSHPHVYLESQNPCDVRWIQTYTSDHVARSFMCAQASVKHATRVTLVCSTGLHLLTEEQQLQHPSAQTHPQPAHTIRTGQVSSGGIRTQLKIDPRACTRQTCICRRQVQDARCERT